LKRKTWEKISTQRTRRKDRRGGIELFDGELFFGVAKRRFQHRGRRGATEYAEGRPERRD
jgi:hypothetical protein